MTDTTNITDMTTMDMSAIIDAITCPITADIMTDPVQGKDGHTYERSAILQALSIKNESPLTREPMTTSDLKVNASIRFLCDKYHSGAFGQINNRPNTPPKISTDSIKLDHTISKNSENQTMLTFNINKESIPCELVNGHLSQDVIIIIDHSGSMQASVEAKDVDGNNLENGLSVQDIVNHAAKTVAKSLDKNSRLGVIIFDNNITILFELLLMTEINCARAIAQINTIKPRGQTNIWHAIEVGIKMLNDRDDKSRNGNILMLTDGSPNISPARGEVETLKRLRKSLNFTSPIYTFGFGYNLQRGLLYDLAKYGNGGNGHIPDGGMVATVFCNFLGTIMSTVVVNLQLHINYSEQVNFTQISPIMGDFAYTVDNDNNQYVIIDIGTVQIGQMRNIIINTSHLNSNFTYHYTYKIGGQVYKIDPTEVEISLLETNSQINTNIARFTAVEMMRQIINLKTTGEIDTANSLYTQLEQYFTSRNMQDSGIFKNITDQIKLAVTNDTYYKRWGEFYIDQWSRSLNQQIKPNFKDKACDFGGDVFESIVDNASDIFDNLPPPEPSNINQQSQSSYRSLGSQLPPILPHRVATLAAYNNQSTPCFDNNCLISMADGNNTQLKHLNKGDIIKSIDINDNDRETTSTIVCILETRIRSGKTNLVNLFDGLIITPWHPIKTDSGWEFPNNIKEPIMQSCESVISLVLDNNHVAFINNVPCVTLGHHFKKGILDHSYYGTRRVIDDLRKMPGWDIGHITVYDDCITRARNNSIVTKITYNMVDYPDRHINTSRDKSPQMMRKLLRSAYGRATKEKN